MVGHRPKRGEIWDSETLATQLLGSFDLVVLKVILEAFSILVSKFPITRRRLVVEQRRVKCGTRGAW